MARRSCSEYEEGQFGRAVVAYIVIDEFLRVPLRAFRASLTILSSDLIGALPSILAVVVRLHVASQSTTEAPSPRIEFVSELVSDLST